MTESEVVARLRTAVAEAGGMRRLAGQWGVSVAYISDCLNGRRAPGPALLGPMRLERVVVVSYEPIGEAREEHTR